MTHFPEKTTPLLFLIFFVTFELFPGNQWNYLYFISGESGRQQFSISASCSVVKSLVPLDTLALLLFSLSSFWFSRLATENRLRVMIWFENFEGTIGMTLVLSPFWYFIEFVGCSFCIASLFMAFVSWFIMHSRFMQSKLMFAFHDQEKITKKNNVQKREKSWKRAKKYWILFQNSDAWRKNLMLTVNSFDIAVSGFVGYGWQIADKAILKKREKFWCALFLCYVYSCRVRTRLETRVYHFQNGGLGGFGGSPQPSFGGSNGGKFTEISKSGGFGEFFEKNKTKRRLKNPWFDLLSSYLMAMIVFFPDRRTFMLILTQKR